ncbi:ribonuclease Y [Babesia caballi]|uniref:Ribonuclease Y n=1 Tax=Babesia caballi TaxID=5871 RepID=A0AAV4LQJ6_BABCB|nr:ribonuclease Y [Babesia caballi]
MLKYRCFTCRTASLGRPHQPLTEVRRRREHLQAVVLLDPDQLRQLGVKGAVHLLQSLHDDVHDQIPGSGLLRKVQLHLRADGLELGAGVVGKVLAHGPPFRNGSRAHLWSFCLDNITSVGFQARTARCSLGRRSGFRRGLVVGADQLEETFEVKLHVAVDVVLDVRAEGVLEIADLVLELLQWVQKRRAISNHEDVQLGRCGKAYLEEVVQRVEGDVRNSEFVLHRLEPKDGANQVGEVDGVHPGKPRVEGGRRGLYGVGHEMLGHVLEVVHGTGVDVGLQLAKRLVEHVDAPLDHDLPVGSNKEHDCGEHDDVTGGFEQVLHPGAEVAEGLLENVVKKRGDALLEKLADEDVFAGSRVDEQLEERPHHVLYLEGVERYAGRDHGVVSEAAEHLVPVTQEEVATRAAGRALGVHGNLFVAVLHPEPVKRHVVAGEEVVVNLPQGLGVLVFNFGGVIHVDVPDVGVQRPETQKVRLLQHLYVGLGRCQLCDLDPHEVVDAPDDDELQLLHLDLGGMQRGVWHVLVYGLHFVHLHLELLQQLDVALPDGLRAEGLDEARPYCDIVEERLQRVEERLPVVEARRKFRGVRVQLLYVRRGGL